MAINVTEELNKINDLIKANGKLTAKDRNAIPQMEMPVRDPKVRARQMDEVALGFQAFCLLSVVVYVLRKSSVRVSVL